MVYTKFPQHCDSSEPHFTQLNEPFDEDYIDIEEVFKSMCFLEKNKIRCLAEYHISADTHESQL